MNKKARITLFSSVATLCLGSAFAASPLSSSRQTVPSPTPSTSPSVSPSPSASASAGVESVSSQLNDIVAVNVIHHINSLEIQENEAALVRVQTSADQQLAQSMLTDHQNNEQQLLSQAQALGVPTFAFQAATFEIAGDSEASTLPDAEYDSAYLQLQLQGNQRALANLQLEASQSTNPQLQPTIAAAITMVQNHINSIKTVQGGGAAPSATPSPSASAGVVASRPHS